MEKQYIRDLKKLNACKEAIQWLEEGRFETLDDAWRVCSRGDWMLWLAGEKSGIAGSDARKLLVLAACKCARLALPYVTEGEKRPLKAIETAEAWARGDTTISISDVRNAAYAAHAAAHAAAYAAYDAAAYAAYDAAAHAADAAYAADAAHAADAAYAADAAHAAAYAAAHAAAYAAAAAQKESLKQCADIVREFYPEAPKKEGFDEG